MLRKSAFFSCKSASCVRKRALCKEKSVLLLCKSASCAEKGVLGVCKGAEDESRLPGRNFHSLKWDGFIANSFLCCVVFLKVSTPSKAKVQNKAPYGRTVSAAVGVLHQQLFFALAGLPPKKHV